MSNTAGQATAFMALTPIRAGEEEALRAFLDGLPQKDSPLARLGGTHFARWVILPDWVNDPAQPRQDHLTSRYLIFTSNFDGPLGDYLDALCAVLAPEAREIWDAASAVRRSQGPGAQGVPAAQPDRHRVLRGRLSELDGRAGEGGTRRARAADRVCGPGSNDDSGPAPESVRVRGVRPSLAQPLHFPAGFGTISHEVRGRFPRGGGLGGVSVARPARP